MDKLNYNFWNTYDLSGHISNEHGLSYFCK